MARLGSLYTQLAVKASNKRRKKNEKYLTQKAQEIKASKEQEFKQTNKRLQSSSNARARAGFAKGLASGLSLVPITEDKKESFGDYRIKQYAPAAYYDLYNSVNKQREKQNKLLNKSNAFKQANFVGNATGTIAGAMLGSGLTRKLASKALATKTATSARRWAERKVIAGTTEKAAEKSAIGRLLRKGLQRAVRNSGEAMTKQNIRRMAQKGVRGLINNVAEDVAYDSTLGAVKDLSTYVQNYGDPRKNKGQFAKYMLDNAKNNLVYGAIGNAIIPAARHLKRNKMAYQAVKVTDDIPNAQGKYSSRTVYEPTPLRDAVKRNLLHDEDYMNYVRKNGINGENVTDIAKRQNDGVLDVLADNYNEGTRKKAFKWKQAQEAAERQAKERASKELSSQELPNKELSSVDADEMTKSKESLGASYANVLEKENTPTNTDFTYRYVPQYDVDDMYISDAKVDRWFKHHTDQKNAFDYGRAHGMQESDARMYARDQMASNLGYRKLTDAEISDYKRQMEGANKRAYNLMTTNPDGSPALARNRFDAKIRAKARGLADVSGNDIDNYVRDNNINYADYARKNGINEGDVKAIEDNIASEIRANRLAEAGKKLKKAEALKKPANVSYDEVDDYIKKNNIDIQAYAQQHKLNPSDIEDIENHIARDISLKKAQTATGEVLSPRLANPRFGEAQGVPRQATSAGVKGEKSQAMKSVTEYVKNLDEKSGKKLRTFLEESGLDRKNTETFNQSIDNAARNIDDYGADTIKSSIIRDIDEGKGLTQDNVAETGLLINKYEIDRYEAIQAGNKKLADKIQNDINDLSAHYGVAESAHGKGLNASKMLAKATPEGRVMSTNLMLDKLKKEYNIEKLSVDPQLMMMLKRATKEADINIVQRAIAIDVWDQIPGNLTEKLSAWRYMSMLLNPKTHIRNIAGNYAFKPIRGIRNAIEASTQKVFEKRIKSLGGERTTVLALSHSADNTKKYWNPAAKEWDKLKTTFDTNDMKFELNKMRPEGAKVFKHSTLNKISDFNTRMLNLEDEWCAKPAFETAYAKYLKAKGIDYATASDDVLSKARVYAYNQALEATYREENALANAINKIRKQANMSKAQINKLEGIEKTTAKVEKAIGIGVDTMIPFAKTPANILKTGVVDFNPLQTIRGVYQMLRAKDADTFLDGIRHLSNGTTGMGLYGLGIYLAHKKIATASIKGDDVGYYDRDRGMQDYSFTFGKEHFGAGELLDVLSVGRSNNPYKNDTKVNATMEWAMPAALPLFMGVEAYNALDPLIKEGFNGVDGGERLLNAIGEWIGSVPKMAVPVFDMSLLSSLESALDTTDAEKHGVNHAFQFALNLVDSRLGQYNPTMFSQIANVSAPNRRNTKATHDGMVGWVENLARKQVNKIPVVGAKVNPEKLDAFGNTVKQKNDAKDYALSALENFISPSNFRTVRNNALDKEAQRLVKKGQETYKVLPKTAYIGQIKTQYGNKPLTANANDLAFFSKEQGKEQLKQASALIKTQEYKDATNAEKANMLSKVYQDAKDTANVKLAKEKGFTDRDILLDDSNYVKKEKKLAKLGFDRDDYAKVYKNVGEVRDKINSLDLKGTGKYVTEGLAAVEQDGGIKNYEQALIALGEKTSEASWRKIVNLYNAGYKSSEATKFILNDKERKELAYYYKSGKHKGERSSDIDKDKLYTYINGMNISQREKWARYEVNRPKDYENPFTF